jgi:uncharacterized membrane protein YccF (DUF307 family)
MKTIANIIWILFGGLALFLSWLFIGLFLCITIIGLPFGVQCFKYAMLSLAPFGKKVDINFKKYFVSNLLWLVFFGWEMFIGYFVAGALCCITIVGIPAGLQVFKLSKLSIAPFGATVN